MYVAESKQPYGKNETVIVTKSEDIANLLKDLENETKEHFIGIYLDGANNVVHQETISVGILNACQVHPREVFIPAFNRTGVASIIVAHNHPSGICKASSQDIEVTKRLKESGKILGIELLDHIIIVQDGFLSLRDEELL